MDGHYNNMCILYYRVFKYISNSGDINMSAIKKMYLADLQRFMKITGFSPTTNSNMELFLLEQNGY